MQLFEKKIVDIVHQLFMEYVHEGDIVIDATAGGGQDTLKLCECVGSTGKVYAFDIQQEAVKSTNELLQRLGYQAQVLLESHTEMDRYAQEGTVDCITFNFGWLPGGDHSIHTQTETSLQAIEKGLKLLRVGGIMSLCIYYGRDTGFAEKDAILEYLQQVDSKKYTVIVPAFHNRPNCPPIPVCIIRDEI